MLIRFGWRSAESFLKVAEEIKKNGFAKKNIIDFDNLKPISKILVGNRADYFW